MTEITQDEHSPTQLDTTDTTCSEKFSLDYDSHSDSNSDLCLKKKTREARESNYVDSRG